jgi:hypothetical protein
MVGRASAKRAKASTAPVCRATDSGQIAAPQQQTAPILFGPAGRNSCIDALAADRAAVPDLKATGKSSPRSSRLPPQAASAV